MAVNPIPANQCGAVRDGTAQTFSPAVPTRSAHDVSLGQKENGQAVEPWRPVALQREDRTWQPFFFFRSTTTTRLASLFVYPITGNLYRHGTPRLVLPPGWWWRMRMTQRGDTCRRDPGLGPVAQSLAALAPAPAQAEAAPERTRMPREPETRHKHDAATRKPKRPNPVYSYYSTRVSSVVPVVNLHARRAPRCAAHSALAAFTCHARAGQ